MFTLSWLTGHVASVQGASFATPLGERTSTESESWHLARLLLAYMNKVSCGMMVPLHDLEPIQSNFLAAEIATFCFTSIS